MEAASSFPILLQQPSPLGVIVSNRCSSLIKPGSQGRGSQRRHTYQGEKKVPGFKAAKDCSVSYLGLMHKVTFKLKS